MGTAARPSSRFHGTRRAARLRCSHDETRHRRARDRDVRGELCDHAQQGDETYSQAMVCPTERITTVDMPRPTLGPPPEDIARDPGRLAVWQVSRDDEQATIEDDDWYRVTGCGHQLTLRCHGGLAQPDEMLAGRRRQLADVPRQPAHALSYGATAIAPIMSDPDPWIVWAAPADRAAPLPVVATTNIVFSSAV